MNIVVDDYLVKFRQERDFSKLTEHDVSMKSRFDADKETHLISWADHVQGVSHSCLETGFFKNALHLDNIGLYHECSLNFPDARKAIEGYAAPVAWQTLPLQSKFGQASKAVEWTGAVIATQYPNDRSILRIGSAATYYRYLDELCAYFGKRAFLKVHPVIIGDKDMLAVLEGIALRHGCEMGHVNVSVIDRCEAVHAYNSTFAVDALMRGKHFVQHSPGYFWQTGAVQYTHGRVTSDYRPIESGYGDLFLDFLLWKYCWIETMPLEDIVRVMRAYAVNESLFPLPEELSYGGFLSR